MGRLEAINFKDWGDTGSERLNRHKILFRWIVYAKHFQIKSETLMGINLSWTAANARTILHLFCVDKLGTPLHQVWDWTENVDAQQSNPETEENIAQALTDLFPCRTSDRRECIHFTNRTNRSWIKIG